MKDKTLKNGWSMLMKFGSEENLKKLQAGQLYMKNLKYYVELEKATNDEAIGDKYDGQMVLKDVIINMCEANTNNSIMQFEDTTTLVDFGYLKCPVFCMFMFDYHNCIGEYLDDNILTARYKFTDEQLKLMPNFGEAVLIVKEKSKFIERVNQGLIDAGYNFMQDNVKYYDFNNNDHIKQICNDKSKVVFWKRDKYSYQQEYRILVHDYVDDHLLVNIGDISDITTIVKTKDLLNTYTDVHYR